MSTTFDFCILGAGLAGLSLADALQERGKTVCVIEKDKIAAGASGTPGGLVNPATGRRATKSWKAEACYSAIATNLQKVAHHSPTPFHINNGVLRPAVTEKMAGKMWERYNETRWPDGWCKWLPKDEIQHRHPGITCVEGGLWLPVGITVDVPAYLQALAGFLQEQGVEIYTGSIATPKQSDTNWQLFLPKETITSEQLVYATGYVTLSTDYWQELPFNPIKGQVAQFKVPGTSLGFDHSISSLGYIANLQNDNTFIQGSTYEHDFEDIEPSSFGEEYLRKRLRRSLPELEEQAIITDRWAGVRVSTPNRKPVLGTHRNIENLHLFTGLGSKGLLYGKFLGEHLADHLVDGNKLFTEVGIQRLYE